ncbi:MAG TPA: hypothetical protein VJT54_06310, partial [Verrucomicrobiae bacterium]|nr:hypothetical protein [Verrucomicrobiae bacterium]
MNALSTIRNHAKPAIEGCSPSSDTSYRDGARLEVEVYARRLASRRWQAAGKRLFDCVVALLLLVLFSPLFAVIAVAVKLSSP